MLLQNEVIFKIFESFKLNCELACISQSWPWPPEGPWPPRLQTWIQISTNTHRSTSTCGYHYMSKHVRSPWRTLNQHVTAHRTHARTHTYKDRHASTHTQIQTHSHYAGSKVSICSCKSFRPQCEVIKSHELRNNAEEDGTPGTDWVDEIICSILCHISSLCEKNL